MPHSLDLRISEQIKCKEIFYTVEHIFTDLRETGFDLDVTITLLRKEIEKKIPPNYEPDTSEWKISSTGVGSPNKGCTILFENHKLLVKSDLLTKTFDTNYAIAKMKARQLQYFLENASIFCDENFDFIERGHKVLQLTFIPVPTLSTACISFGNLSMNRATAMRKLKVKVIDYLTRHKLPEDKPSSPNGCFTIEDHLNAIKLLLELQK